MSIKALQLSANTSGSTGFRATVLGDSMVVFVAHLLITAALLLLVANFVPGIRIAGWGPAFLGAIVLGLVNATVRPLMILLTLPLTVLTFGFFLLIVNALMLWLSAALVPGIQVRGFVSAFLGSLLLTLLNLLVASLVRPGLGST